MVKLVHLVEERPSTVFAPLKAELSMWVDASPFASLPLSFSLTPMASAWEAEPGLSEDISMQGTSLLNHVEVGTQFLRISSAIEPDT